MDEPWDFEFLSRIVEGLVSFLSEFVDDWTANDMRVAVFKILFSWLVLSLIAIHFAWKVYGNTVNDMYYRQGENFKLQFYLKENLIFGLTRELKESKLTNANMPMAIRL